MAECCAPTATAPSCAAGAVAVPVRRMYVPPHLRKQAAPKEVFADFSAGCHAVPPLSDGETSAGSSVVSEASAGGSVVDGLPGRRQVHFASRSDVEEVPCFDYAAVGEDWSAIGEERAWRFRSGQLAVELRERDRAILFAVWCLLASQARIGSLA